jgi:heptosyltransferase II
VFYILLTWLASPLLFLRLKLISRNKSSKCHILVIQTAKIGDVICTTPIFREIKHNRPDAKLTVLCSSVTAPLLELNPHVDSTLVFDTKTLAGIGGKFQLAQLLNAQKVDISICLSPNLAFLLIPLWVGISTRVSVLPNFSGLTYTLSERFLTHSVKHHQGRLFVDTMLMALTQLAFDVRLRHKEVFSRDGSEAKVRALLGPLRTSGLIGIGIGSGNKLKSLSQNTLENLIRLILEKTDRDVVLIGSGEDQHTSDALCRIFTSARVLNTVNRLALQELPALLERLTAYVGVDSGVTYMADAVGTPLVDIMGPADPEDQRPTGERAKIMKTTLPCAPCSHTFKAPYRCAIGTRACVVDLTAETIFEHIAAP